MSTMLRRCLTMTASAAVLAIVLLAAGVPAGVLLGLAPALICVGMHMVMGHGEHLPSSARAAGDRSEPAVDDLATVR